jgi:hypothetical protein
MELSTRTNLVIMDLRWDRKTQFTYPKIDEPT